MPPRSNNFKCITLELFIFCHPHLDFRRCYHAIESTFKALKDINNSKRQFSNEIDNVFLTVFKRFTYLGFGMFKILFTWGGD